MKKIILWIFFLFLVFFSFLIHSLCVFFSYIHFKFSFDFSHFSLHRDDKSFQNVRLARNVIFFLFSKKHFSYLSFPLHSIRLRNNSASVFFFASSQPFIHSVKYTNLFASICHHAPDTNWLSHFLLSHFFISNSLPKHFRHFLPLIYCCCYVL